ncbi:hypothetical protein BST61_g10958 [Cercospora zeina]
MDFGHESSTSPGADCKQNVSASNSQDPVVRIPPLPHVSLQGVEGAVIVSQKPSSSSCADHRCCLAEASSTTVTLNATENLRYDRIRTESNRRGGQDNEAEPRRHRGRRGLDRWHVKP